MSSINRRNFISTFTSGIAGLGLAGKLKAGSSPANSETGQNQQLRVQKYNPLGKTGLKVSDVSCGAISLFDPNVLRYAYDLGVNYFDTAESYLRTQSESFIGKALKDVRDKVILVTKHGFSTRQRVSKESILKRMEDSLKRMQTDYVDVALVHGVSNVKNLENEELRSAYAQLKKEGKVRFTGFSTHNAQLTLKQTLDSDFAEVVLLIYNHDEGKDIEPLLESVHEKGIGTVAMKVFAGGKHGTLKSLISQKVSYPQAAIRWVLSNPSVDCCIVTMSSYSHVEDYVAASGQPLNRADLEVIAQYQHLSRDQYCRVSCTECLESCPQHVAINDTLRFNMYFEDYGMEKEAIRYYAELDEKHKPVGCSRCQGPCSSACPYGLKVREKLIRAHELLTV